jgi:sugar phosphate isomerase/epimerase
MRSYSLSYLTASSLTPPQAVVVAGETGYRHVGLRLSASMPGGPFQDLLHDAPLMRETQASMQSTGVGVFDIEVIRVGEHFDASAWLPLLEAGAALTARAVLVVGDDPDAARLAQSFGRLCELARPFSLTIDLEFLPWTQVRDANGALAIVDAAGRPSNAGVLVDALHMARSTSTLADIAALPASCVHYAQICDGPGNGTFTHQQMLHTALFERLLPGEGGIDLKGIFQALPPGLPVSIEIPHHVRQPQLGAREWARQALVATRALLEPQA